MDMTTHGPSLNTEPQQAPDAALRYRERGYLTGRCRLHDRVQACRERVSALLQQPDAAPIRWWGQSGGASACTLTKLPQLAERDEAFLRLARDPALVSLVESLIGPALIFRDVLIAKPSGNGAPIYYHQDASYWDVDRPDLVLSAWIALDDAPPESGALQVYAGSHVHGLRDHDLFCAGVRVPRRITRLLRAAVSLAGTGDNPRGARQRALAGARKRVTESLNRAFPRLADLNQLQLDPAGLDAARLTTLPAQAGDVILFHSLLVHGSGPNLSPRPRRAYIVTYMSTECTVGGALPRSYLSARA